MLNRRSFLQLIAMVFGSSPTVVIGRATASNTPAQAVRDTWKIFTEAGLQKLLNWFDAGEASRYRSLLTLCLDQVAGEDELQEILTSFQVSTRSELKQLDDQDFFRRYWQAVLQRNPEMKDGAQRLKLKILGAIPEGLDIFHVVYQLQSDDPDDALACARPQLMTVQSKSDQWLLVPKTEFIGLEQAIRRKELEQIDFQPRMTRADLVGQLNQRTEVQAVIRSQSVIGKVILRGAFLMNILPIHETLFTAAKSGDPERFQRSIHDYCQIKSSS